MPTNNITLRLSIDSKTGEVKLKNFAKTAEKSIDRVGTKLKTFRTGFSKLSNFGTKFFFGLQGLRMLTAPLGNMIRLSNEQEKSDKSLAIAMKQVGEYSVSNFKAMKDQATAIQGVTTTGDEAVQMMQSLALNMGVSFDKIDEVTRGAIGLGQSFAKAGLNQETAMKGIALAYQGNFTQLQRYIPALRSAGTNTEKMAILQKAMSDGFKQSEALAKTGAGQMTQYKNIVGDFKEKIGDLIKKAILPLIAVFRPIVSWLNTLSPATITFSGVAITLTAVLWKVVPAIRGISAATKLLGISIKGALGWIGLIITAATLLYTAWDTNLGGFQEVLRNIFSYINQWIDESLQIFKGFLKKIGIVFGVIGRAIYLALTLHFDKAIKEASSIGDKLAKNAHDQDAKLTAIRKKGEKERLEISKMFAEKEKALQQKKSEQKIDTEKKGTKKTNEIQLTSAKKMFSGVLDALKKSNEIRLKAANLHAKKVIEINDNVQKTLTDADIEQAQKGAAMIINTAQMVGDFFSQQRDQEAAERLKESKAKYKAAKIELDQKLKDGKITKAEYEQRLNSLNANDKIRTDKIEADRRKRSGIEKAAAVASIMLTTIQAAMSVYKAAIESFGIFGPVIGAVLAGTTMVFGTAKAAQAGAVAYAQGGIIDQPHVGVVGEAGPEIIAPKKTFIDVVQGLISGGDIRPATVAAPVILPGAIGDAVQKALSQARWNVNIDSDGLAIALETGNMNLSDLEY